MGLNPCDILPDGAVQAVLGASATHSRKTNICRYINGAGQMEIAALPPNSYYSREYETLAAEGMGSLQIRERDHSLTVVLDRGLPAIAYVHIGNATYSLNIDRNDAPATVDEYVRVGDVLGNSVSQVAQQLLR